MTLKLGLKFLDLAHKYTLNSKGFSKLLIQPAKFLDAHKINGVTFKYTIPKSLCIDKASDSFLSVSAAVALFDELSTHALLLMDKTHRPGASVHLSAEILKPIVAGQEVKVVTRIDKIGKSLGFCQIFMYRDDTLVSRGKHIKYLPMGMLWNFLFSEIFLPYTLMVYDILEKMRIIKFDSHSESNFKEDNNGDSIFNNLNLSHRGKDYVNHRITSLDTLSSANYVEYTLSLSSSLYNLMKNVHGGALAMAIEKSVILSRHDDMSGSVDDLEIRYLNSLKVRMYPSLHHSVLCIREHNLDLI
jgi:acyl-coenzyme A thioesterase PaaI-like protein